MSLAEFDWLVTPTWTALHHASLTQEDNEFLEDHSVLEDVVLTCGRRARKAMIPGVLSRMDLKRCDVCCRRRGMPPGHGSPKNDQACRAVLRRDGFIGPDTPQRVDLRDRVAGWCEMPQEMRDERHRRLIDRCVE